MKKNDSITKCSARCCNHSRRNPNSSWEKSIKKWINAAKKPISMDKNNMESSIKWKIASIPSCTIHNARLVLTNSRRIPASNM